MNIPEYIYAGDTVKWSEDPTNGRTSADWTMVCVTKDGAGHDAVTTNGVANAAGGWDFTIADETTDDFTVGTHYWQIYVTKSGEKYTVGSGSFEVRAAVSLGGQTFDGRSQAQIDLDAVKAAIRARISGDATVEYTIGNRSLKKEPLANLIALRTQLEADVAREKQAKRLSDGIGRAVFVRFGR